MFLAHSLVLAWLAFVILYLGWTCVALFQNIRTARSTGLKYVVVPWYSYSPLMSLFMRRTFLRLLNKVAPQSPASVLSWRVLVTAIWPLRFRHAPFADLGTDTFLIVSPGGIVFNTADAKVVSQITSRATDFPKPIHIYRAISIYGMNVVTSEGEEWRHHRRLTSPAFSEHNNQLVFKETIERTQVMLAALLGRYTSSKTVPHLADDVMRLSLDIIGHAALGQKVESQNNVEESEEPDTRHLKAGHTMTYSASLRYITTNTILMATVIAILPLSLLKRMPFERLKRLYEAYDNWGKYMQDMITERKLDLLSENTRFQNVDLLGQLVKGQVKDQTKLHGLPGQSGLTNAEVMGNLFIFIIAGHETSASSLHMTILLLALHPQFQKQLQQELEDILQGRPASEWDFGDDLPRLVNSFLSAVWYEELRLVSPTLTIPKFTTTPQKVLIDGQSTLLPANMMIRLCLSALHVNPKYWRHGPASDPANPIFRYDNLSNDMEEFNPQRWMRSEESPMSSPDWDTFQEDAMPDTPTSISGKFRAPRLRTPPKGSFIPFSDGQRSCLGKRFAQIEIITALAVIFSQCSVELAVDEWAAHDDIGNMSEGEKREVWNKAAKRARHSWQNKLTAGISVQMTPEGHVPLRFVTKGHEKFFNLQ